MHMIAISSYGIKFGNLQMWLYKWACVACDSKAMQPIDSVVIPIVCLSDWYFEVLV